MSNNSKLKTASARAFAAAAILALSGVASCALAQANNASLAGQALERAFSSPYVPVGMANSAQSQIVYYRPGSPTRGSTASDQGANVYVDGEFQSALLPGGYTAFCINPGMHAVGAFLHEAPAYRGKTERMVAESYAAGQTYFFKVREDGSGVPIIVPQAQAEQELQSIRKQVHALSRSSSVTPCRGAVQQPLPSPPPPNIGAVQAPSNPRIEALQREVRFEFAKSNIQSVRTEDRSALIELARQFGAQGTASGRLVSIGHADQIGNTASAYKLGMLRADAVRGFLISNGVPAERISVRSAGNTEPLVMDCREDVACAAPNRRVVIQTDSRRGN